MPEHLWELQDNWDSYGGKSPTREAALITVQLMQFANTKPDEIILMNDGGFMLTWYERKKELCIIVPGKSIVLEVTTFGDADDDTNQEETYPVYATDTGRICEIFGWLDS